MDEWIFKRSKTVHDPAGREVRVLEDASATEGGGCNSVAVFGLYTRRR